MIVIPKLITGLNPLQINNHEIQIRSGVAAVSGDTPDSYITITGNPTLRIDTVGALGVDRPLWVGWGYLWGIGTNDGSQSSIIMSPSYLAGNVILPTGYNRLRYLGAPFYINGSSSGMRRQVLTSWPNPIKFIYQYQNRTEYEIDVGSTGGEWKDIDLSFLVPKEARIAYLSFESTTIDGAGGVVRIRTPNCGDGGFDLKSPAQATREIAVSSDLRVQVLTSIASSCKLRVLGFEVLSAY